MEPRQSLFTVTHTDELSASTTIVQQGLVIGRLPSCNVVLNHPTVSRIHAGINKLENEYYLINLSVANTLTINGRLIPAEHADVLASGDEVQIGPYTLRIERKGENLSITVEHQVTGNIKTGDLPALGVKRTTGRLGSQRLAAKPGAGVPPPAAEADVSNVLKVFWEKRTRDKTEGLSPLHPREKMLPGKTRINWHPTRDLARAWPLSLFFWAVVLLGGLAVVAALTYAKAYAPAPLSNPHTRAQLTFTDAGAIAKEPNAGSCTTCHRLTAPVEKACTECHQAGGFHADVTDAHVSAGITCTACHTEHRGAEFSARAMAFESCAACHNDNNRRLYNGKRVFTPHDGTLGYPVQNGQWVWAGLSDGELSVLPAVAAQKNERDTRQVWLNKQFHALHLYRAETVSGLDGNKAGELSCSSCHKSFTPIDRETPRTTCSKCHQGFAEDRSLAGVFDAARINCTSCHVQHVFDVERWGTGLTAAARSRRAQAIAQQIARRAGEKK